MNVSRTLQFNLLLCCKMLQANWCTSDLSEMLDRSLQKWLAASSWRRNVRTQMAFFPAVLMTFYDFGQIIYKKHRQIVSSDCHQGTPYVFALKTPPPTRSMRLETLRVQLRHFVQLRSTRSIRLETNPLDKRNSCTSCMHPGVAWPQTDNWTRTLKQGTTGEAKKNEGNVMFN